MDETPKWGEGAFVRTDSTDANAMMRKIHNGGNNHFRMPNILTQKQELPPAITSKEKVADLLTVFPEQDISAFDNNSITAILVTREL